MSFVFSRLFHPFRQQIGRVTLISWSLFSIAGATLIWGLSQAVPGIGLPLLLSATFFGFATGWGLGSKRLRQGWVLPALFVFGAGMSFLWVGRLGPALLDEVKLLNYTAQAGLRWFPGTPLPDIRPLQTHTLSLVEAVIVLFRRLGEWGQAYLQGQASYDPVSSSILWVDMVWNVCAWAGWAARRWIHPLGALTPAAGLLFAVLSYVGGSAYLTLPFLAVIFLLSGWRGQVYREAEWQQQGVDFAEDIRLDLGGAILMLTLALLSAASLAPSLSIERLNQWAQAWRREPSPSERTLAEPLGLQPRKKPVQQTPLQTARVGGLPRDHLLGSGPELSEQVVFWARTGTEVEKLYWRSLLYDQYTGRGWATSSTRTFIYPADEPVQLVSLPPTTTEIQVEQEIRPGPHYNGLVYATGQLIRMDHPFQADWRTLPTSEENGDLFGALLGGSQAPPGPYRALSRLNRPDLSTLEQARGTISPEVRDRYLQLPESVPGRVHTLARDLTATQPSPYARALALQTYLRRFPYSLEIPRPPTDRDVVDYFLFDLKTGYCDYYASAMVVLARAAGLPARLVVGYATGGWDEQNQRYQVTEAEAHSWPEIYLAGAGWVEFEPTPARPIFEPSQQNDLALAPFVELPPVSPSRSLSGRGWLIIFAGLFLAGFALVAITLWLDLTLLRRLPVTEAPQAAYRRLYWLGNHLSTNLPRGHTPQEFTQNLKEQLTHPHPQELQELLESYQQAVYSPFPVKPQQKARILRAWSRLRIALLLGRWDQFLRRIRSG